MISREDVTGWLEAYNLAWTTQSPEAIVQLFSPEGRYFETPFLVHAGRDEIYRYWLSAPGVQRDIRFQYEILSVFDSQAVVHWSAQFERDDGPHALDGIFLLKFNERGQCDILREWWHSDTGGNAC